MDKGLHILDIQQRYSRDGRSKYFEETLLRDQCIKVFFSLLCCLSFVPFDISVEMEEEEEEAEERKSSKISFLFCNSLISSRGKLGLLMGHEIAENKNLSRGELVSSSSFWLEKIISPNNQPRVCLFVCPCMHAVWCMGKQFIYLLQLLSFYHEFLRAIKLEL